MTEKYWGLLNKSQNQFKYSTPKEKAQGHEKVQKAMPCMSIHTGKKVSEARTVYLGN